MAALVRINKLLSQMGIASRRRADELIKEGAVFLNGEMLKAPGVIVDVEKDTIALGGKVLNPRQQRRYFYYLVNKPQGYICTVKDTHGRRKIVDLAPKINGIFPVGRLDKDTTGLILLTNDGGLAHRLMHPRYNIEKIYEAHISGGLCAKDIQALQGGVDIQDKRPSVCEVLKFKRLKGLTMITLKIHEGRKRQIRMTFEALGYKVISLKRINYAGLDIDIEEGRYRELTDTELQGLKRKVGLL